MTETTMKSASEMANRIRRCLERGDIVEAEALCSEALTHHQAEPDLLLQAGNVNYFRKRYDKAAELFQQIMKLRPKDLETRTMLWGTYRDGGDFDNMLALAREFQDHPLDANETFLAYRSYLAVSDWHAAATLQDQVIELLRKGKIKRSLISAVLIDLCSNPELSPEKVYEIHRLWGDAEVAGKQPFCSGTASTSNRRLKVAYISTDFNAHPVGAFIYQLIRSHDKKRFEVYCYANLLRDDAFTQHFREHAEHFIDISQLSNEQAASRIHADGIDILIDLGGHTSSSRLSVLAYKPAPVQMTYLGYPNTTGLPTVDYRISDSFAESADGTRYVEKLLQMPQSFLCYGTELAQPPADVAPVEKNGFVTFASLNHVRKLTPQSIAAWSSILNRVPGSRLMMKARTVESGADLIIANILKEFASHGIDAERIEFLPFVDSHEEHMLQYNEIDIVLDTFPYNGTTTTCDAVIMGVPVITLVGNTHAQRVSYSILKNIGYEESITDTVDAYIEKAVQMAGQPENLSLMRKILPSLFKHSILGNSDRFARQMEGLYLQAWQEKGGVLPEIYAADTDSDAQAAQTAAPEQQPAAALGSQAADPRMVAGRITKQELSTDPIVITEIGARILDPRNNAGSEETFHSLATARVIAFEADADACEQINALNSLFVADIKAYPYALSDKAGEQTLYVTNHKMCSSLYKPNEEMLARYSGLEVASLDTTCPIEVTTLDWFMEHEQIPCIDFMKIDVQGAELDIFKGANKAMPQLLGICTEVEFTELYKGQPLFAEVDAELRSHGLQFHHFTDAGKVALDGTMFKGKTQQLWADAIYFPSFESIDELPANRLLKLAVLTSLYEAYDLTQYVLKRYDAISGSHYEQTFLQKLTAIAEGRPETETPETSASEETGKQESGGSKAIRIENDLLVSVPDDLNLMTPYVLEEQQDWFEDEIKFVRKLIKPGMKIIDIGANYGTYALTMAKLAGSEGHLWAFEPASATADYLQQSIDANGLDQVELIRAALSNRQGEAQLSIQGNAELNSLTDNYAGCLGTETVPLYRLDDCMQEYGWQDIDFMKLDAEGEELRILEGGEAFFKDCSPLVMFELKHGETVNEGLIQAFQRMGYDTYKYVPGLMMLVPFNLEEEIDLFQLNLFCCKPDRAKALQEAGLLSMEDREYDLSFSSENPLAEYLNAYPYSAALIPQWEQSDNALPGATAYITALNAYAVAQASKGKPESYQWLQAAFLQLISALDEHANLPRLLTLARISSDLGKRSAALQALSQFADVLNSEQQFNPVEPFLAASERAAKIDPGGELADWCFAQALAERERMQAFSSYFTGSNSLPVLNLLSNLDYNDPEMDRRLDLIKRRYA